MLRLLFDLYIQKVFNLTKRKYFVYNRTSLTTVNVEIFAHYIFSRISRRALDGRKFDVCENYNYNRTNRNKQHMREN